MPRVGIIAGSGFYDIEGVRVKETTRLVTPFGDPSDEYLICESSGIEFAFLSRHGRPHRLSPHRINYRANIWGFREMGVERIFSVNAVGGIRGDLRPGDIIVPDQIIDMTHDRAATFYEENEVVHIDFTDPYCPALRNVLFEVARHLGRDLVPSGTYLCVNGPRLETRAEIGFFEKIGADVVGMTAMPEAGLARELEMCLAALAVVTNYAAGIEEKRLTTTEVVEMMKITLEHVRNLLIGALRLLPEERNCACKDALRGTRM